LGGLRMGAGRRLAPGAGGRQIASVGSRPVEFPATLGLICRPPPAARGGDAGQRSACVPREVAPSRALAARVIARLQPFLPGPLRRLGSRPGSQKSRSSVAGMKLPRIARARTAGATLVGWAAATRFAAGIFHIDLRLACPHGRPTRSRCRHAFGGTSAADWLMREDLD
jgi:hypothetical protein